MPLARPSLEQASGEQPSPEGGAAESQAAGAPASEPPRSTQTSCLSLRLQTVASALAVAAWLPICRKSAQTPSGGAVPLWLVGGVSIRPGGGGQLTGVPLPCRLLIFSFVFPATNISSSDLFWEKPI